MKLIYLVVALTYFGLTVTTRESAFDIEAAEYNKRVEEARKDYIRDLWEAGRED
jgi:hypothetical protein